MGNFEKNISLEFDNFNNNNGESWIKSHRVETFEKFKSLGIPKLTDEDWRFTNLSDFSSKSYSLNVKTPNSFDQTLVPEILKDIDGYFIILVNGKLVEYSSDNFQVHDISDMLQEDECAFKDLIKGSFSDKNQDFSFFLNSSFLDRGCFIEINSSIKVQKPIVILNFFDNNAENSLINHRNIISISSSSSVKIIEYSFAVDGIDYFSNKSTFFYLDDNSNVEHLSIDDGSKNSHIFSNIKINQGRDSNFTTDSILIGGKLFRNNVHPILNGEGSNSNVLGLYLSKDSQLMDNYMFVEHAKAHCDSRQLYKGLLNDDSKGVFHGRILVHNEAQKTDAKQTNRNLLLSNTAQVDTKPQLEIYADDVKCTHGATTGQIDKEALYYLRARGINEDLARIMMIRSFTEEVLEFISDDILLDLHKKVVERWFVESNLISGD
ncbi:MAG: Fe-S cluster assembly protein SufD [Candidatus Dadabacteria bacterium]|nr:Fe-S cluster assembly protein SufD [Candidatus Dadabacteria bacterium]|tara:strand:- start:572 stop:1876 length:1305 start_codon:yes stop_codon:yes gene_type:complete